MAVRKARRGGGGGARTRLKLLKFANRAAQLDPRRPPHLGAPSHGGEFKVIYTKSRSDTARGAVRRVQGRRESLSTRILNLCSMSRPPPATRPPQRTSSSIRSLCARISSFAPTWACVQSITGWKRGTWNLQEQPRNRAVAGGARRRHQRYRRAFSGNGAAYRDFNSGGQQAEPGKLAEGAEYHEPSNSGVANRMTPIPGKI